MNSFVGLSDLVSSIRTEGIPINMIDNGDFTLLETFLFCIVIDLCKIKMLH